MKNIAFDSGPIISLALNNLLWTLNALKLKFGGEFYITPAVMEEIVERPLKSKRFKFEAYQVAKEIRDKNLVVVKDKEIKVLARKLLDLGNRCFYGHVHPIGILHIGEMEAVACAIVKGSLAVVIDERTTRVLIEDPSSLHHLLERKLHTKIIVDKKNLNELRKSIGSIKVLRSVELITMAFEMGLLDKYLFSEDKKELLDSLLWGLKLNGCAISAEEIDLIEKSTQS